MSDDLPTYARALQSRKKRENQGNLMDDNFDEACFYSSQSRNFNYNRQEKPIYDSDFQTKQQYTNYDSHQNRRGQRMDYDYNQNTDYNNYNNYDYNQNKERSSRHTRKRRSQPTYIQNPQPNSQQLMQQPLNQYQQQVYQQQQQYQQQYPPQNQKSQTHRKRSFPTDKIDLPCSGNIPEQQTMDDTFSQKQAKQVQPENNFNELNSKVITELQQKNRDLINEIRALKTSRNEDEINELRAALQTQKNRNAQLFQDLQNSENQVADTKQLLVLKDTTIQNLQDECQKLRIEYQDLLASIRIQNDQIAQLSRRNRELELEIEKTKFAQQCYNMNMYPTVPFSMNSNINNNSIPSQRFYDGSNGNAPQMKAMTDQNAISPNPSVALTATAQNSETNSLNMPSTNIMQNKGNVHPAMKDNLFFEEPPKKADDINVQSLTDVELREKYNTYTQLKDSKNWILSRAPPKGANFSHVRQEKEKLADECDELARICSKIKLEMKLRGIF